MGKRRDKYHLDCITDGKFEELSSIEKCVEFLGVSRYALEKALEEGSVLHDCYGKEWVIDENF